MPTFDIITYLPLFKLLKTTDIGPLHCTLYWITSKLLLVPDHTAWWHECKKLAECIYAVAFLLWVILVTMWMRVWSTVLLPPTNITRSAITNSVWSRTHRVRKKKHRSVRQLLQLLSNATINHKFVLRPPFQKHNSVGLVPISSYPWL